MNSFIGWIGGKKALREVIVSKFPQDRKRYVEVFGGAGWVYFHKPKQSCEMEVFNDFDKDLVNLYRCVKFHREELVRELSFLPSSREIFFNYVSQMRANGLTDIQRAARYFYLIKTSFGNSKTSFATTIKTIDGTLDRFEEIQKRLSRTIIENKDFESLIKTYDRKETLFYCDPPYNKTEHYYAGAFNKEDHIRLRDTLSNIKGKFILSYNDDEFIRELYKGFNIESAIRKNSLSAGTNDKDFKELIISNH